MACLLCSFTRVCLTFRGSLSAQQLADATSELEQAELASQRAREEAARLAQEEAELAAAEAELSAEEKAASPRPRTLPTDEGAAASGAGIGGAALQAQVTAAVQAAMKSILVRAHTDTDTHTTRRTLA